ncbi:MAG: hypothetical protein P8I44_10845 [Phycisphaerales bacterium]|nr:hypothetical protein [Phycisphaerales bacterium]
MPTPPPNESRISSRWRAFGPGLLFAGAAVGVSHVVQSTRGGAEMGTAAILVVVIGCLIKWPSFRFGAHYAAVTGRSLLHGYRLQGRWVLVAFAFLTASILFTTLAAVTMVTAGLLLSLAPPIEGVLGSMGMVSDAGRIAAVSAGLLAITAILLASGGYRLLEGLMKVVMPVLVVATLVVTVMAIRGLGGSELTFLPPIDDPASRNMMAAMVGWMPAPIDIAVWSSLWTIARAGGRSMDRRRVLEDFDAGFISTLVLAILFVLLGASLMRESGVDFQGSSVGFSNQIIELYTTNLGDWSRPLIASVIFVAMLSTTVTVADGFPRTVAALFRAFGAETRPADGVSDATGGATRCEGSPAVYWAVFVVGAIGAIAILVFGLARRNGITFTGLVDFVTVTSFIAAPALAWFNHRSVFRSIPRPEDRPSRLWYAWSWFGISVLGIFAAAYVIERLGG